MDLSTRYLGLELKNPLILSASPLDRKIETLRRLEEAGLAAVTLHSLFEEQIKFAAEELSYFLERGTESFPEALTYYPESATDYHLGPEQYLDHIAAVKRAVKIPVIASLNGSTPGGWFDYARQMEEAGADALEVNLYFLPTDPEMTGTEIEQRYVEVLRAVKSSVRIPVAMKLSPYFSNMANMATQLDQAGADGLLLFNRFYQPMIDVNDLEVHPSLKLSTPEESRLPIRWAAILFGRLKASLAVTGGVHSARETLQALMAGASAVSLCSALLQGGPPRIVEILGDLRKWLETHEYETVNSLIGILSQRTSPDPQAFERANYMKTLASYRDAEPIPH